MFRRLPNPSAWSLPLACAPRAAHVRSSLMLRAVHLAMLCCLAGTAAAASVPGEPDLLDDALVVVRANDLLWCDRQIAGYAAAANRDTQRYRNLLAQMLFRSRSLAGLDLTRPALVAWRDHSASMVAILPISDRRAFMADFGADTRFGTPLVRFKELDGTTVYSQNTAKGLVNYRLLIQDDTAYFAATVAECRKLADRGALRIGEGAPLEISLRGRALLGLDLSGDAEASPWAHLVAPSVISLMHRYGTPALPELADQIARIDLSLDDDRNGGGLSVSGRLLARADAPLAHFLAVQKNLSSRLLPLISNGRTAAAIYGAVLWQGELDRLGQDLAESVGQRLGPAWTAQTEESWRRSWALRDRNGTFAGVLDLDRDTQGRIDTSTIVLTEQGQAGDLLVHAQRFAEAERSILGTLAQPGLVFQSLGIAETAVASLPGWRHRMKRNGRDFDYLQVATGRHLLCIESEAGISEQIAKDLVPKVLLDGGQKPEGTAAVLAGWVDGAVIARIIAGQELERTPTNPRFSFSLKSSSQGDLVISALLPLLDFAMLEREVQELRARPAEEPEQP